MTLGLLAYRAGVVGAGTLAVILLALWIHSVTFVPIDDPGYFCGTPDPDPVPGISASIIVRNCAAGRSFTLAEGQTIGVDVTGDRGVDRYTRWTEVTVSDTSVLASVRRPVTTSDRWPRVDEVALYRAARAGQATIEAVQFYCGDRKDLFGNNCDQGHRWKVVVRVT